MQHRVVAVLAVDPAVDKMVRASREWDDLVDRQMALLADVDPGPAGLVKATVVFAGVAAASGPLSAKLDRDELLAHLIDTGRRALGLRVPRAKH